ncbi:TlpA disulfide reductase family protein [Chitinophaga cymbidii]|uniref:Thiol:disulfide interchange protein n=1 Tax=Chitinophaga cymbidii TaxID=1096750 RepID=A0A512RKV6_9BACT|nr:TlpA disulfide reductase family protein [Chitinophaga cymbidii]GEP96292.1 thiol:disulfide interchange protein [Chitinophaga cymbidii]
MKHFSLVAAACLLQAATARAQSFTLTGTVEGKPTGYVYLSYDAGAGDYKMDSAQLQQGRFTFKGTIDGPSMSSLFLERPSQMSFNEDVASLFLEPGNMTASLQKGKMKEATLKGSKAQEDMNKLNAARKPVMVNLAPLSASYNKQNLAYIEARKAKKDSATLAGMLNELEEIKEKMEPYYEKMNAIDKDFIEKNPASFASAYLLRFRIGSMKLPEAEASYNRMPPAVQQSAFGKEIKKELEGLRGGSPGSQAYVFSKTDINGQPLSLNDYKGKYVLVDFWASWCVPCRKGNPHLKALYAKYKDKGLEIIGISDDDGRPDAWKKAVAQDGIGHWKHVLRGLDMQKRQRKEPNPEDISDYYGIHSLPTKILIDPKGMIIGRYGGGGENDEAMDKKLAEVMGN